MRPSPCDEGMGREYARIRSCFEPDYGTTLNLPFQFECSLQVGIRRQRLRIQSLSQVARPISLSCKGIERFVCNANQIRRVVA